MEDYERVILVKSDVFIYKIPPRTSNRAHRASDWGLDAPSWTGRLRVVAKGKECILKLEDKMTGELFGKCPIDKYPGIAIESVSDSSRYFVIRLQDDNGRNAFIGIGFSDRGDSFDLNVALQDFFKILQKEEEIEKEPENSEPKLDLGFKDGQTIKVNLNIARKGGSSGAGSRPRTKPAGSGLVGGILLPPPPGAKQSSNASSSSTAVKANTVTSKSDNDFLLDLNSLSLGTDTNATTNTTTDSNPNNNNLFGDFKSNTSESSNPSDSDPWTQFQ